MAGALWQHKNFMRLWQAQSVSAFGSRITRTALPYIAVAMLGVPEVWLGGLAAAQFAPGVMVAMFAGGFIDRADKRKILIAADLVRALLVFSLPVAYFFASFTLAHVIIVGAGVGAATAIFMITDNAFLPQLVASCELEEGNSKLEATDAIAEVGGPALGGALISGVGAAGAVIFDGISYLWSALWLARISPQQSEDLAHQPRRSVFGSLRLGLRLVFSNPHVRPIVLSHIVTSITTGFFITLYSLYCLRELGLSASTMGIIVGCGGLGAFAGAWISPRLRRRFGIGPTLVICAVGSLVCEVCIPLAQWQGPVAMIALLITHQVISDGLDVAYVIQAVTVRQTVLPTEALGRCNAAIFVVTSGTVPIAALVAGAIANQFGTVTAIWIGLAIGIVALMPLPTLWGLRELPDGAGRVDPALPLAEHAGPDQRPSQRKLPRV